MSEMLTNKRCAVHKAFYNTASTNTLLVNLIVQEVSSHTEESNSCSITHFLDQRFRKVVCAFTRTTVRAQYTDRNFKRRTVCRMKNTC